MVLGERDSPCLSKLFVRGGKGCIGLLTQGEQRVNTSCRKGCGEGKLLGWTVRADLDTSSAWRTLGFMLRDQLPWSS